MENSETLRTPTSVRFDEAMERQIDALADQEHRSFSNMVRVLVSEALSARSGKEQAAA